jgi:hypothetical protein
MFVMWGRLHDHSVYYLNALWYYYMPNMVCLEESGLLRWLRDSILSRAKIFFLLHSIQTGPAVHLAS